MLTAAFHRFAVYGLTWTEQLLWMISRGPLGLLGPILALALCLCLAFVKHAPWYIKTGLIVLLVLLLLILFGPSLPKGGAL